MLWVIFIEYIQTALVGLGVLYQCGDNPVAQLLQIILGGSKDIYKFSQAFIGPFSFLFFFINKP